MQIDLDLARAAVAEAARQKARLTEATIEATAGEVASPSKRDEMLRHIVEAYGVELPDLRADTLRRRIDDPELPAGVRLLLELRLEATKTSTAKYTTVVKATSADGRLRNTMLYDGAGRTGRRSHKLFQPGNMPRPKNDDWVIDLASGYIKSDSIDLLTDNPLLLLADMVRGLIVAAPGNKLVQADLANIEGRGLAWLAGEEWKLDAFRAFDTLKLDGQGQRIPDGKGDWLRAGPDLYVAAYARSFAADPAGVNGRQRQIGKVQELALGYGGGVAAFLTFAAVYEMDLDELTDAVHSTASKDSLAAAYGMWDWAVKKRRTLGLERNVYVACEVLKAAWRVAHPATEALWSQLDAAFRKSISTPGVLHKAGEHLAMRRDGAWLRMRLPSGRCLCYLRPKIDEHDQLSYAGVSPYTHQWGRIKTYGGKLAENATQALAADVLKHGQLVADEAGYPTVLDVHDEILSEVPDTDDYTHEALASCMSTAPHWAEGLPLSAKGFTTYRYRKD
jgi:DNA polymerase